MRINHEFKQCLEVQLKNRIVNIAVKVNVYIDDIRYVEQYMNAEGTAYQNLCRIYHDKKGEMIVLGSYAEVSALVFPEEYKQEKVGFKQNEDIRPKGRQSHRKRRSSKRTRV